MPMNLLVIPARGGSQGIPRKPLVKVCGRPLLWYTIDYVRRLGLAGDAVVVTDDEEIVNYAADEGVGAVREPAVASHDENSLRAVYRAVQAVECRGRCVELVTVLQPTQPVRPDDIIERCLAAIEGVKAVLTVHTPKSPPQLMATPIDDLLTFDDYRRRQDCPLYYCANGLCYAYRREVFDQEPKSLPSFHREIVYRAVPTAHFPYVDIDEPSDLDYFRFLLEHGHTMWPSAIEIGCPDAN